MNRLPTILIAPVVILSVVFSIAAQTTTHRTSAAKRKYPIGGSAPSGAKLQVAPDLDKRLAKFKAVQMPFNTAGLSAKEVRLVNKLVEAARYIDYIYWRQSDPEALTIYQQLQGSKNPRDQKIRRFLFINGSRYDLIDENKPFIGNEPAPPGRGLYPHNLTREQIEQYVKEHPDKKKEIYSETTVVRWHGDQLEGVPYHVAYRSFLEPAAKALREAAALSDDKAFADFLRARADALLSDDYYPSDLKWMDLKNPKFDIIYAPYETYLDDLLGVKGSFGAAVMIRNEAESKKLDLYQKYVPDIQNALPVAAEFRPSKEGHSTPMEVMDTPYRAGDLLHGYQAVADNLPNDARIHAEKGSKKLFFKNFMDARVEYVVLPVAKRLMLPDQAAKASAEGYLSAVLMHEICHGLGPVYATTANGKVDIREAIGPIFSALEEAKADVAGMFGLNWLIDQGVLPKDRLQEYYSSYVAGSLRSVRFGVAEAHGRAQMMELNYLIESGAIKPVKSAASKASAPSFRYEVDYAKMPTAMQALAKELLEIEGTGDRARAERWFAKYDKMPADLKAAMNHINDVPVDIYPVYSFPEIVQ